MKTKLILFVSVLMFIFSIQLNAQTKYPGKKHTTSHGGTYSKGKGSSHKGGSYKNPKTNNHYGKHK